MGPRGGSCVEGGGIRANKNTMYGKCDGWLVCWLVGWMGGWVQLQYVCMCVCISYGWREEERRDDRFILARCFFSRDGIYFLPVRTSMPALRIALVGLIGPLALSCGYE